LLGRSVIRIVLIAAAVVIGYLLFNTATTALKSHSLANDEQSVRVDIAQLQNQQQQLTAIREYLSSDEYIESVARRTLGLVKPGETRVLVSSPDAEPTPATEKPQGETWWEGLFGP
jgi:cell division protein FtsB